MLTETTRTGLFLLGCLTLAGCSVDVGVESDEAGLETVASSQQEFQNSVRFVGCGAPQIERLQRAANILSDRIYENQGRSMRACLLDGFLSNADGNLWASDIWAQFNRAGTTTFRCTSNLDSSCGGLSDWWGCAREGSESVTLANQMINDPSVSDAQVAGLIAHELTHNYGHGHSGLADGEYDLTVPQRARSCVSNNNTMPTNESRAAMPGEVELGPVGRMGGSPYEHGCTSDFVSGFRISSGSGIDAMGLRCQSGVTTALMGRWRNVVETRYCASGSVVVGVRGRAGSRLDQLQVICAPTSNLGVHTDLDPKGGDGGQPFESLCPAGKAVRRIRARSGSQIDSLQLVCDTVGRTFSAAHYPVAVGQTYGTQTGTSYQLRCSGDGALNALVGRAGARIDRLSGACSPTGATLPITAGGPEHIMVPVAGGGGGSEFRNACPNGELMVGVRVRSGSRIDALSPICAPPATWDAFSTGAHNLTTFSGGSGGTLRTAMCPSYRFLVGLNLWTGSEVDGLGIVCRDMR